MLLTYPLMTLLDSFTLFLDLFKLFMSQVVSSTSYYPSMSKLILVVCALRISTLSTLTLSSDFVKKVCLSSLPWLDGGTYFTIRLAEVLFFGSSWRLATCYSMWDKSVDALKLADTKERLNSSPSYLELFQWNPMIVMYGMMA